MTLPRNDEAASLRPLIREASNSDVDFLEEMDEQGRALLGSARGGNAWLAEHPPITDVIREGRLRITVVEIAGSPVGYSVVSDEVDVLRGRICWIERIYVDARAREIGCGDALLAHEIESATDRGCIFIEADALPGDRETKNLYERAGLTARRITVSRSISDPSTEAPASR